MCLPGLLIVGFPGLCLSLSLRPRLSSSASGVFSGSKDGVLSVGVSAASFYKHTKHIKKGTFTQKLTKKKNN